MNYLYNESSLWYINNHLICTVDQANFYFWQQRALMKRNEKFGICDRHTCRGVKRFFSTGWAVLGSVSLRASWVVFRNLNCQYCNIKRSNHYARMHIYVEHFGKLTNFAFWGVGEKVWNGMRRLCENLNKTRYIFQILILSWTTSS